MNISFNLDTALIVAIVSVIFTIATYIVTKRGVYWSERRGKQTDLDDAEAKRVKFHATVNLTEIREGQLHTALSLRYLGKLPFLVRAITLNVDCHTLSSSHYVGVGLKRFENGQPLTDGEWLNLKIPVTLGVGKITEIGTIKVIIEGCQSAGEEGNWSLDSEVVGREMILS
ncbi:hypothetical protein [Vibrio sp. Hal054]|uniref:hypothetical protein n=1 Tax=Vibrio sp. Hal054 TaxID=3035158 RepID=UPI00301D27B6